MSKYRVLCLHGYRQDGAKLRGRIAAFRRVFKSSINFGKAGETGETVKQLKWWDFERDEDTGEYTLGRVDESLGYVADFVKNEGPFDGIFGFSQGGTMASMILQRQSIRTLLVVLDPSLVSSPKSPFAFRFGIFVSAAGCGDPQYASDQKVDLPSLHIMGETDAVVAVAKSRALLDFFVAPKVFVHAGGHYIPTNKEPKDAMREFVKQLQALDVED
ncbi:hypothetical protein BBJ28_00010995 [Nothophytophthora sp. Chile5]|nr:hypothetical protein BBJ28_00010995 [Nothophytophthora sp. Chile5]